MKIKKYKIRQLESVRREKLIFKKNNVLHTCDGFFDTLIIISLRLFFKIAAVLGRFAIIWTYIVGFLFYIWVHFFSGPMIYLKKPVKKNYDDNIENSVIPCLLRTSAAVEYVLAIQFIFLVPPNKYLLSMCQNAVFFFFLYFSGVFFFFQTPLCSIQ